MWISSSGGKGYLSPQAGCPCVTTFVSDVSVGTLVSDVSIVSDVSVGTFVSDVSVGTLVSDVSDVSDVSVLKKPTRERGKEVTCYIAEGPAQGKIRLKKRLPPQDHVFVWKTTPV